MAVFNPFLPSYLESPYPAYAALRAEEPVHFSAVLQGWVLTGYEHCASVLRDHETFSSSPLVATGQLATMLQEQRREFPLGEVPTVLSADPPAHTRLRSLVNRAFTPRTVEDLRPRIEDIAESLLADARPGATFDVATGLAQPLPIIVIAELLGVPADDRDLLKRWSTAIASTTNLLNLAPVLVEARRATTELIAYIDRVASERRARPADDLLSALIEVEDDGERLSHDELLAFSILLLLAGHETTTNLIGNGTLALAEHPAEAERLRAEPGLLPSAVEELLRYDSPVQGVARFATRAAEVGGQAIEAGATLLLLVGAANRDPAQFADPDALDLGREPNRHLSFGRGIHFCLGAPLARLEAEVVFRRLLERFPELRVAEGGAERAGTLVLRGLSRLELAA
jgi:cytochrome P450